MSAPETGLPPFGGASPTGTAHHHSPARSEDAEEVLASEGPGLLPLAHPPCDGGGARGLREDHPAGQAERGRPDGDRAHHRVAGEWADTSRKVMYAEWAFVCN